MFYERLKVILVTLFVCFNVLANEQDIISNHPNDDVNFTAREDILIEIQDKLKIGNKAASLVGIPGIGKSTIITRYLNLNKEKYKIIWVFDCNKDLNQQFQVLAKNINYVYFKDKNGFINEDLPDTIESVLGFFKTRKDWIIVFDNLEIEENGKIEGILETLSKSNGDILIGSQHKDNLPNIIEIKNLSREDSMSLVEKISKNMEYDVKNDILDMFEGYPFGIVEAINFLNQNSSASFKEYKKTDEFKKIKSRINDFTKTILTSLSRTEHNILIKCALLDNHFIDKRLILKLSYNEGEGINALHSFNKNSIIYEVADKKHDKMFVLQMHKLIRDSILELSDPLLIKDNIKEITYRMASILPSGITQFVEMLESHIYLVENLESLLKHCVEFKLNQVYTLPLRKQLMLLYLVVSDYEKLKEHIKWFDQSKININNLNDTQLNYYGWILSVRATYYYCIHEDYRLVKKYFDEAIDIISALDDENHNLNLKLFVYLELAQASVYLGDIEEARSNFEIARSYINKINTGTDWGLFWYIESVIYRHQGDYLLALDAIEKTINYEKQVSDSEFSVSNLIMKANILMKLNRPDEAYEIARQNYDKNKDKFNKGSEKVGRLLLPLIRAELALKKPGFKDHLKEAREVFENLDENKNKAVDLIIDDHVAVIYILEGDMYSQEENIEKAIESYNNSYIILKNRYQGRLKNEIFGNNLCKLFVSYLKNNNIDKCVLISQEHEKIFGADHFRTKDFQSKIIEYNKGK